MNPSPAAEPSFTPIVLLGMSAALSLFCIVRLWQMGGSLGERIFWTFALCMPVLGPIFFGALFRPPSVQGAGLRCAETPGVRAGAGR